MTKFKIFIKKHRIAVNVLVFLFFLVLGVYCLYPEKDIILSLPPSSYFHICFSCFCVCCMADRFVFLFDEWIKSKKRIS